MAAVRYDATAPTGGDGTGIARTLGVGAPGGGIGMQITIDDTVVTSKAQALRNLEDMRVAFLRQTFPAS